MKYKITYEIENDDGIGDDLLRKAARLASATLTESLHPWEADVHLRSIAVETHDWKQLGV